MVRFVATLVSVGLSVGALAACGSFADGDGHDGAGTEAGAADSGADTTSDVLGIDVVGIDVDPPVDAGDSGLGCGQ